MKQVALLETEQRKNARRTATSSGNRSDPQVLQQEIDSLRKDLQTAERLVKQADSTSKSKDLQVKRLTEGASKLKEQLNILQKQAHF